MTTRLALGRFEVGRVLGAGAEGTSYAARDVETGARVVLKCVAAADRSSRLRLLTEFERLAALRAPELPAVIAVGEVGDDEGLPRGAVAMALERVDGNVVKIGDANEVAMCVAAAARGLEALHHAGLVHHDVKPSHLLRDASGGFRLIDLGLARPIGLADGLVRGTLGYLSPEALVGAHDVGVDLWALGVTAYELMSGRPPYAAATVSELLLAQARGRAPLAGPPAFVALVDALLADDPQARPSRARLVAEELERAGLVPRGSVAEVSVSEPGFVASSTGRARTLEELDAALTQHRLVGVVGAPGSGRTRLVEELHQRRLLAALREGATPPVLVRSLDVALATSGPALALLDDADERSARDALSLRPHLSIAVERTTPPSWRSIELPPLDAREVASLCERVAGSATHAELVARRTGGSPTLVLELLRTALRAGSLTAASLRAVELRDVAELEAEIVGGLDRPLRELYTALALIDRAARVEELGRFAHPAAIAALESLALVEWRDGGIATLHAGVPIASLVDEVGAELLTTVDDPFTRAWIDRALGRIDERGLESALASDPGRPTAQQLVLARATRAPHRFAGEVLFAAGRYDEARLELELAGPTGKIALARTLRALGRREDAARVLADVEGEEAKRIATVLSARLALDAGEPDRARALLRGDPPETAWARAEQREVRGLAALAAGELDVARAELEALRASLTVPRRIARAEALLGMVAQAEGSLDDAAARYERALELADRVGDAHGAAVYAQNLGGVLRELGELERALAVLDRAVDVLGRLGRAEERGLARFNLGNLQRSLGDLDAARRAVDEARASGGAAARWAELLAADLDRQEGRVDDALARYAQLGEMQLAAVGRAETLAEAGRLDEARAALVHVTATDHHTLLGRARVLLAVDPGPLPVDLAAAVTRARDEAVRSHARDRALRAELILLRNDLRRRADDAARTRLESARTLYEEIRMRTPELRRAALATDPDVQRLVTLLEAQPARDDARLRRLLEINKRLNSELDLDRLLELILDTVIEVSRAERGFVLLQTKGGALEPRVERNVEAATREGVAAFSRSIAERAIAEGQPIVTVDAADDRRFEAALSIVDLKLRSVLAVPLTVKGRVVGCVYVDHRARTALFRPDDVALVTDLAEQAAIAVENARLLADNRAQEAKVRALNAQLEEKLASQTVELEGLHREVRESRRSLGVRYDYSGLVGQTPRMVELFRLLDRVTDTALPVVIYGESGTGKELVARAIHHNGPRRKAAFVSESCAAIPETLLEAALFGHVRGAFTGAQGERRGLFEIADGGTLFLDEVGEMSPGMQVRLLRVLQEGEFRRVGGEKIVKVDVRVLVASNRDLGRMVEEGKFREDLFYRLNVVRIALPPLRERLADVPLLVEHFLAKRSDKRGITRRALDRLQRFRWPGNIRQLENELARAASLAEGPVDVSDLSPQVQSGLDEAETAGPEPLDLHGRVERLERGLLDEALRRSGGNYSEAARLLGMSRFGLQKKLTRYGMKT